MLIVISYPKVIANEAKLINQLFDAGLALFHLRKPEDTEESMRELIRGIDSRHYSKLVIHQHHPLAKIYGIGRLHFTEVARNNLRENELANLKSELFQFSTSVHSLEDYINLPQDFNYSFLGPVFNSISKKDYKAIELNKEMETLQKHSVKLIALGGITKYNLNTPYEWGFDGVAALGSIWESKDPVKEFKELNKACKIQEIM